MKLRILKIQILRNSFFFKKNIFKNPILKKMKIQLKKKRLETKLVRAWSKKYPSLMASIFFWKIHFETIQFWMQENPMKKENVFKKIGQSFIPKISFTHGLKFFLKNPFWNNPILNTGKSNEEKKTSLKIFLVTAWSKKYPLLMASILFWENPFWNNPILNTG